MIYSRLLRGMSWAITGRALSVFFLFGINIILAKLLQPEQLGSYFIITSIMGIFILLTNFSFPIVSINKIAGYLATQEEHKILSIILKLLYLMLFNGIIIGILFYAFIGENIFYKIFKIDVDSITMIYISLNIFASALINLIGGYYRGFHDIRLASIFNLMPLVLFSLVLLIYLINFESIGIEKIFLYLLFTKVITILVSAVVFKKKLYFNSQDKKVESLSDLLMTGAPITIANIILLVNYHGPLWIIGFIFDTDTVAIYGTALKIAIFIMLGYQLMSSVLHSTLAELYKHRNFETIQLLSQMAASILSITGVILFTLFALSGESILALTFGNHYVQAYGLLIVISLFYVIEVSFGISKTIFIITGHEKSLLVITLSMLLVRILLAVIMFENMELYGIALAWGIGGVLQQIWGWCQIRYSLGIKCHANYRYKAIKYIT